ncbi:MAG TPA: lysylphosphatidylglycerol synthase transmembrane domain-containing protein [Cellulomonadaceae bacterium]|nr:lysylphosphatidylglycerol synthase transmembrane domain-containing protein [Cellulomonadaceae bacterium]
MPDDAVPSPRGARRTAVPTIQLPVDPLSAHGVEIVDTPEVRVHHPSDLLNAVLCTLAIALMMLLAVYAHGTTTGVTADVRNVATVLRSILIVPIAVLEGLVTLILPATVLIELSARRLWRQVLEALAAGFVGLLVGALLTWGIVTFGSAELVRGMSVYLNGRWTVTVPGYMSAIAGLVTAAGSRARRRTVAWSWNVLWVALGVVLITGQVSLTGAAVAVLAGRLAGLGVRYVSGVQSERAYGAALVAGIRRAGFEPVRLSRVRDGEHADDDEAGASHGLSALASTRLGGNRVYEMTTSGDRLLEVVVMDGDRQVIGVLSRLWRSLRMRGIDGRTVVSLRQAAERAALLAYAARAAGVRTPQLLAVAEADASMLFVQEHPEGAVPLSELAPEQITDTVLQAVWDQVRLAHAAGIAHRALTSATVLVCDPMVAVPEVWVTGWDSGDVASSDLARRMDLTQMVAMLAVRVGARRALASATAILPSSDIASIGPLLQTIALPRRTRDEIRAQKRVLAELRAALVEQLPEASIEPERLVRLGARAVLTVILTSIAVVVVLTSVNVTQISQALAHSDWRWSVVAFALGVVTLVGAALTLVAFSPVKLPLWRTILVQTAATFIALAAPAGVGPAALNMRMLTRRGVTASLAVATVALVQVSQFVVTIALLVVLSIASGTNEAAKFAPTTTTLVAVAIVVVLVASAFLVPRVRRWVATRTVPTLQQTWPRLIEIVGQPGRLALGFTGNVVMTMGYVFALESALAAFGQSLSLVQVAVIYLGGNAAGAIIPMPGGLGSIDGALIALLGGVGGINLGVATSVAVLFRVLTFWLRVPLGWASMRILQRSGEL